MFRITGKQDIF